MSRSEVTHEVRNYRNLFPDASPQNSVSEFFYRDTFQNMEWHNRMNQRLKDLGWSIPDLAARMGKKDDQPLIERLYKYAAGKVAQPRGSALKQIAGALDMSEIELRNGITAPKKEVGESVAQDHNARIGGPVTISDRIPLRGQGMGGTDGALIISDNHNLGDVLAPPVLNGVPNAYAVYVVGDSMLERYEHGELVYVHPHLPPRKGNYVVAQISGGEGEPVYGYVKRFVSRDDKRLKLEQLNPKKILQFPNERVVAVHVIVMGGRG